MPNVTTQRRETDWKGILSKAFVKFFLERPGSLDEAARRVLAISFSLGVGITAYSVARNPVNLMEAFRVPREQRSITHILAADEKVRESVIRELEEWFYGHRPHGLMLAAWDRLDEVVGVWVRPRSGLSVKPGTQPLIAEMRELGGHFMFGECHDMPSNSMPGKRLVACPIFNGYDVWGWIGAVVDQGELDYMTRSLRNLSSRLQRIIY